MPSCASPYGHLYMVKAHVCSSVARCGLWRGSNPAGGLGALPVGILGVVGGYQAYHPGWHLGRGGVYSNRQGYKRPCGVFFVKRHPAVINLQLVAFLAGPGPTWTS